jgi:SAM-dependent methyltransferase
MVEREPMARDPYDELAEEYADRIDSWAYNADYERPAVLSLLPDLDGARVLDAGCGPGKYAELLLDRGADVVGVDVSGNMLAEARDRVGGDAAVLQADLATVGSLFEPSSFDVVVSALTLHYVEEWQPIFDGFADVLRPGGAFVFSIQHPFDSFRRYDAGSYFSVEQVSREWDSFEDPVEMPAYRRPVSAVFNPLVDAGFALDRVVEPTPLPSFEEKLPEAYETLSREPRFMCVGAHLPE